jgi:hypothetical protein
MLEDSEASQLFDSMIDVHEKIALSESCSLPGFDDKPKVIQEENRTTGPSTPGASSNSQLSVEEPNSDDSSFSQRSRLGRKPKTLEPTSRDVINKVTSELAKVAAKTEEDLGKTSHEEVSRIVREKYAPATTKEFNRRVKEEMKEHDMAPRSDILTTRLARMHSKLPLYIAKERKFVKTQDYKSTKPALFSKSFDQSYQLFLRLCQDLDVAWDDSNENRFSFVYLHFPIEKVIKYAESRQLISAAEIAQLKADSKASSPALLRDITSMKQGYKPMFNAHAAFRATLELTIKLLEGQSHRFGNTMAALLNYQSKLRA